MEKSLDSKLKIWDKNRKGLNIVNEDVNIKKRIEEIRKTASTINSLDKLTSKNQNFFSGKHL